MRQVIAGRLFDTERATRVACGGNGLSRRDFNSIEESLYKTTKGAWFTAGEGGPATRYARTVGTNEWTGGEAIIPMSKEEALRWLEQNATADIIEANAEYLPQIEEA